MPNTFAYIVLYSYPLVVFVLFRRLPVPKALIWSILAGYLILPTKAELDLPMLPTLDKSTIPALSAALMIWLKRGKEGPRRQTDQNDETPPTEGRRRPILVRRRGGRIILLLIMVVTLAPFGTYYTNQEPVVWGPVILPAMSLYDAFSMILSTFMLLLPFLLARQHLNTPEAHRDILRALVWAGLVCSLFILIEVRLSPQLSRWTYGFFPRSFAQHVRNGGFRPILFLEHGLRVGIFMSMTVLAAATLFRFREGKKPILWLYAAIWLLFVLYISKTLGAFAITLVFIPLVILLKTRTMLLFAAVISGVVLIYPLARGSGFVPLDAVTEFAESVSAERAQSFNFRLENEENLLARANMKPAFGWGLWYRNGILDETGRQISITDGLWVIVIGVRGWIGYLGFFGLLTLPIFLIFAKMRQLSVDGLTVGLAMLLAANLIDLIPNSGLVQTTWLIAGALAGRYELGARLTPARGKTVKRELRGAVRKPTLSASHRTT